MHTSHNRRTKNTQRLQKDKMVFWFQLLSIYAQENLIDFNKDIAWFSLSTQEKVESIIKNEKELPVKSPFHSNCWWCYPYMSSWQRNRQCHQVQRPPFPAGVVHSSSRLQDHYAYHILCWQEADHWKKNIKFTVIWEHWNIKKGMTNISFKIKMIRRKYAIPGIGDKTTATPRVWHK